jgi:hypothetical protein
LVDKAIATNHGVVVIITVLLRTIFVKSTPKTSDKKSNKWRSSRHVESDSTCHDDHRILIQLFPVAADQSENGDHGGGRLLSCQ